MTTDPPNPPIMLRFSADWLKLAGIVLGCIGFITSFNLAWFKLIQAPSLCGVENGMDCELVVRSVYAHLGSIPVAYLGLAGYLVILVALVFESRLPSGKYIVFGLALLGFLFAVYLTAIQAIVFRLWCGPCVINAAAMIALFIVLFIRLWRMIGAVSADDDAEVEEINQVGDRIYD